MSIISGTQNLGGKNSLGISDLEEVHQNAIKQTEKTCDFVSTQELFSKMKENRNNYIPPNGINLSQTQKQKYWDNKEISNHKKYKQKEKDYLGLWNKAITYQNKISILGGK